MLAKVLAVATRESSAVRARLQLIEGIAIAELEEKLRLLDAW